MLAKEEIWYDVTYRIRVRLGETTVNHLQQHYTMVKIVGAVFGKQKASDGAIKVNDLPPEQAVSQLNQFFGQVSKK